MEKIRVKINIQMNTIIAAVVAALLFPLAASAQSSRPNIVYLLVDNWGWGDVSIQGSTIQTANIDQFASEGMRLLNFNVENQCTPTRSAIHTGRLPIRSGTQKVPAPGEPQGMAPWEYTIAELLSDSGYATAMFGKWHIGDKDGRLPNDQGYDEWYGTKESAMEASYRTTPQFDPDVFDIPYIWAGKKGKKSRKVKEFNLEARTLLDSEIVDRTIKFVQEKSSSGKPFFVYAALTQIHPPFLPHPEFVGKSGSGPYADIQIQVDAYVGRILKAIDKAGVADNTIVILTGDNAAGEQSSSWGGEGGSNGPWRGGLSTGYEGGTRTPGMIRWPGKIPSGVVTDEILSDLDWFPTIAHLIGEAEKIPTDRPIDGVNQTDFLLGKQKKSNREHIITYVGDRVFSVKWRSIKVHFFTAEGTFSPIVEHTFPQVFDIKNDPGETRELWSTEGYSHLWVMKPVMEELTKLKKSISKFPNIKPGQDFEGYSKKKASLEDAATIKSRLTRDGRVALYGIFFDLNEAEIKPASKRTIESIAKVLKDNPELKIAVVGHTDGTGTHKINMNLSKLRADNVVATLARLHKIQPNRLFAAGAGFLAPVATNDTDEGRALNRRVELIRMK